MELLKGSLRVKAWRRLTRFLGLPQNDIERAVHRFGAAYPEAVFVQIGANDGDTGDPLRLQIERRRWRGVMVEPVPYVFRKLREKYGEHARIRLEMSAIAARPGVLPFYHLREALPGEKVWRWYHVLGSFRREVILKHADAVPDIEARIVETPVPCLTFDELCRRHEARGGRPAPDRHGGLRLRDPQDDRLHALAPAHDRVRKLPPVARRSGRGSSAAGRPWVQGLRVRPRYCGPRSDPAGRPTRPGADPAVRDSA